MSRGGIRGFREKRKVLKEQPAERCAHLLGSLQPLLQLQPQLVGGQPELGALGSQDPLS